MGPPTPCLRIFLKTSRSNSAMLDLDTNRFSHGWGASQMPLAFASSSTRFTRSKNSMYITSSSNFRPSTNRSRPSNLSTCYEENKRGSQWVFVCECHWGSILQVTLFICSNKGICVIGRNPYVCIFIIILFLIIITPDSRKWWFFGHFRNCGDRNVSEISMIRAMEHPLMLHDHFNLYHKEIPYCHFMLIAKVSAKQSTVPIGNLKRKT